MLMERCLSSYLGDKVTEYLQNENRARELGQFAQQTRFITQLRCLARENGVDISKYFQCLNRNGKLFFFRYS